MRDNILSILLKNVYIGSPWTFSLNVHMIYFLGLYTIFITDANILKKVDLQWIKRVLVKKKMKIQLEWFYLTRKIGSRLLRAIMH